MPKLQKTYIKGDDFYDKKADHKTYGINECISDPKDPTNKFTNYTHYNKIEIYGDHKLRKKILRLLNESK
jgi:hypothetical protein